MSVQIWADGFAEAQVRTGNVRFPLTIYKCDKIVVGNINVAGEKLSKGEFWNEIMN